MTTPEPSAQSTKKHTSHTAWFSQSVDTLLFIVTRILQRNITQVASSLTFTTILAIVPLLAVVLSLFTAFPLFDDFRAALQEFLSSTLMPAAVSSTVMENLNQFAAKASSLTAVGSLFLIVTSIMLMSTIDQTFNDIWYVTEKRPWMQRVLVYWAILSLGPILAGASIWASTILAQDSLGHINTLSFLSSFALSYIPFILTALAFSALFVYVPNRRILWRDAFVGGVFTTLALEILKSGFAFYLKQFPTYTLIYGAFATVPIFLMWVYLSWLVVLVGASLVAILPNLRRRSWTNSHHSGAQFLNALSVLELLWKQRTAVPSGLNLHQISMQLRRDPASLHELLKRLKKDGYVVNTIENEDERWVLSCDPALTPLAPLVDALLIDRTQADTPVAHSIVGLINLTVANPALNLESLFSEPQQLKELCQRLEQQLFTRPNPLGVTTHAESK
ncbi:YihY family inner membrane protein [Paenalcaligenes hominis]|uniref:YihY family inner membrane protein n=1 Tax=Paenalcaligenes hominis TaxID=643674 RepID=UPI003523996B